jgi:NhaP-type Na+/H+ or K+/H+ antiporter
VPVVAVFLALGALLGPSGLDVADIGFQAPALHALAMLGLALVLFSDAVTLETTEIRTRKRLLWLLLGPGTLLPAVLVSLAAWWLLDVPGPAAAILGAALASTDPVLLRTVLRSRALPEAPRVALRLEAGTNDVVLLPIVVISMLLLRGGVSAEAQAREIGRSAVGLFILGPLLGALVGWVGITALAWIRSRMGVRRDYESMYALGLAFTAFAAAESVGGSGFLASFAAGVVIAAQDIELCDCFLEYGEATAEMLLLLTFVALGTTLIWTGLTVIDARTLAFAAIALSVRTVVLYPVLRRIDLSDRDRRLIAFFGPRGLSSLLLVLLPVFAGLPGAEHLFAVASLVVLLSVVIHGGGTALFLRARAQRRVSALAEDPSHRRRRASKVLPQPVATDDHSDIPETITLGELEEMRSRGERIVVIDSRASRSYRADSRTAAGSIRLDPDDPVRDATEQRLSQRSTLVVYCA